MLSAFIAPLLAPLRWSQAVSKANAATASSAFVTSMSLGPLSFFLRPAILNVAPSKSGWQRQGPQQPCDENQCPAPIHGDLELHQNQQPSADAVDTATTQNDPSTELRARIQDLYVENVTDQGVNYVALIASPAFAAYKVAVGALVDYHAETLLVTDDTRVAFFVNLYNALTIHAFAELGPPAENSLARLLFNAQASYVVGGHRLSLNDMENGVLRGNRGVSMWPRPFGSSVISDPRLRLCVDVPEPRIHFVLNCGAASCPPIRFLTADKLEGQLALATSLFLYNTENFSVEVINSQTSRPISSPPSVPTPLSSSPSVYPSNTPFPASAPPHQKSSGTTHIVTLSAIFRWYKTDFAPDGTDASLLLYIASCVVPGDRNQRLAVLAEALAADPTASRISVRYARYDWSLNAYKAAPMEDVDDDDDCDGLSMNMRC
jgi:hypothetical protein